MILTFFISFKGKNEKNKTNLALRDCYGIISTLVQVG
jgi:hypothetical protein